MGMNKKLLYNKYFKNNMIFNHNLIFLIINFLIIYIAKIKKNFEILL